MHHGPDPYQRALADLDELLAKRDTEIERWALDAARYVDRVKTGSRSLANAVRLVLRVGLTPDTKSLLHAALEQFDEVTK